MHKRRGFTLVEIMVVVAIIGVLAAMAIASLVKVRRQSLAKAFMNDLRIATDAFQMYTMNHGTYPADANRRVVPNGMDEYLSKMRWTEATPLGGVWDWEHDVWGIVAGVSVVNCAMPDVLRDVDRLIDDGDLATGSFRSTAGDRHTYVIE